MQLSRRGLLGFGFASGALAIGGAGLGMVASSPAQAQGAQAAQRIADHFSSVKSMTGEFVQFGPRGEQTGGKFFLSRPGKLRFNYEAPSSVRVISDGKAVVVGNSKLKTWELYPLSSTPLKLLLSNRIDLSKSQVKSIKEEPDLLTIVLGDRSVFGNSTISMMFDPKSFELRQWTIRDAQGKDTSVMIYNVKQGVAFDPSVFKIPYDEVRKKTTLR
ncbi:outer membrane lipoprotein carrier protein LolA [Pseudohoeflea coraliihabitans]